MKYPFEDRDVVRTSLRWEGMSAHICWILGAIFAILGIVAGAIDARIGLETTHWFIMAAAFWVWGFWAWLTAYNATKEA